MKRLLVIRFSSLGDLALLVPVARVVAEQNPNVEITILSQNCMADLFADLPANVRFHGVDIKRQSLREIVAGKNYSPLFPEIASPVSFKKKMA